jgi:hypothetical protein
MIVNDATPDMGFEVNDLHKLFDEELPAALVENHDEAKRIGGRFQLNITGAGEWYVDLTESGPACVRGTREADCTLTCNAEDFKQLMARPQTAPVWLFLRGRLRVDGHRAMVVKLNRLFTFKK